MDFDDDALLALAESEDWGRTNSEPIATPDAPSPADAPSPDDAPGDAADVADDEIAECSDYENAVTQFNEYLNNESMARQIIKALEHSANHFNHTLLEIVSNVLIELYVDLQEQEHKENDATGRLLVMCEKRAGDVVQLSQLIPVAPNDRKTVKLRADLRKREYVKPKQKDTKISHFFQRKPSSPNKRAPSEPSPLEHAASEPGALKRKQDIYDINSILEIDTLDCESDSEPDSDDYLGFPASVLPNPDAPHMSQARNLPPAPEPEESIPEPESAVSSQFDNGTGAVSSLSQDDDCDGAVTSSQMSGCANHDRIGGDQMLGKVRSMRKELLEKQMEARKLSRRDLAPGLTTHWRRTPRAELLLRLARFLPPNSEHVALLSPDVWESIQKLPHLNVEELSKLVDVIEISRYEPSRQFADTLRHQNLTFADAEDLDMRSVSRTTLVVVTDHAGIKKFHGSRAPEVLALALFVSKKDQTIRDTFGSSDRGDWGPARLSVLRLMESMRSYCRNIREQSKGHIGRMHAEGTRRMRAGLQKDPNKCDIGGYAHIDPRWRDDKDYADDVTFNAVKVCHLETTFVPFLAAFRNACRESVGLPGLNHALGDAVSAPAIMFSSNYQSPMHVDGGSANSFPESIAWVKLKVTGEPWHFCIPAASCVFDLDKSAPCFCILQAADTLHGTLHHAGYEHDGCGTVLVSSSKLMTEAARELMKRGGKRPRH